MSFLNLFGNKIKAKDVVFNNGQNLDTRPRTYAIVGSVVKTVGGSSACAVHTLSEIQALFQNKYGVKPSNSNSIGISYVNGDGGATEAHFEGATFLNNKFYVVFDRIVSTQIRVNYCYIYVV